MTAHRLPQRVLLTTDAVGGVWTYTGDLATGLAGLGVTCTLLVLGPPLQPHQRERARGLDVRESGLPLDWLAADANAMLAAGRAVAGVAERAGADVVHLHAPALAAAGGFPVPVVVTCHSCVRTWWHSVRGGVLPPDLAWRAELAAAGYARAQALLAPTQAFAVMTRDAYRLPRPPVVVHNGREPPRGPPAPVADVVFTAGRLWDEGKNVAALDRLAARLSWPVLAAGPTEGPNGSRVALTHATPLGMLDDAATRRRLAARPVFVSLARYEPFGLAALEAAQAGCALVLAERAGFRELWDDAAVFVAPEDEDGAATAIDRLMRNPDERARIGARAAARAARYSVAAMADGTARVYRGLAAREAAA